MRKRLDRTGLFYRLEQTMNNSDSKTEQAFRLSPSKHIPGKHIPGKHEEANGAAAQKAHRLKARLAKILAASGVRAAQENGQGDSAPSHFGFGVERLDAALRGNAEHDGLPRGALHEIHSGGKNDWSSAATMAMLLAQMSQNDCGDIKPILWVSESGEARRQGKLYPPGLVELGIDPDMIIHVAAPDSIAVLRAASDGVRSGAAAAVIAELAGRKPKGLDMTATRRLSLSAQKTGALALLLRSGSDKADPLPTAAFSRWEISAAPSVPLEANAPGHPAFDITLLRHRSGLYGLNARLEWNCNETKFNEICRSQQGDREEADTGAVSPLPAIRTNRQNASPDIRPRIQAA